MPNWVKISIEATNTDDFDFRRDFTSFNDVIPMPRILRNTTAGSVSAFVKDNLDKSIAWLIKNSNHKPLELARSYYAFKSCRYVDWYDWSMENWGCKWDMNVVHIDKHRIEFDTPWSLPEQVIDALFEKYPSVAFSGEFAEEQSGWFSGTFDSFNGQISYDYDAEYSTEAYERYFSFWGGEEDYQLIDGKYVFIDD